MAIIFLCVNIKYRNQRYIKMSSPQLNNLIIIGCILTYSSVILLGLDSGLTSIETFPYVCTARAWTLMAGFSLAFGAMFSKTWRVHSIFTDIKLNKKVILLQGKNLGRYDQNSTIINSIDTIIIRKPFDSQTYVLFLS